MHHKSGNHGQSVKDLHEVMGLLDLEVDQVRIPDQSLRGHRR